MKDAVEMARRRFLLLGAGVGGMLLDATQPTWLGFVWRDRSGRQHACLTGLLSHQESARFVGRTYLDRYPHEADVEVLVRQVAAVEGGIDYIDRAGERALRSLLQERIRRDFADEKIVTLEGWMLSVTEARLCALAALA